MPIVNEIDLSFNFSNSIFAEKIDETLYSSTSLSLVDFFVSDQSNKYRLIEIKDPDIPTATNPNSFKSKLISGELITSLSRKIRDTIFLLSSQNKINNNNNISYIVLISMQILDPALILTKQDELRKKIPLGHTNDIIKSCVILKVDAWNRRYPDDNITRLSTGNIL